MAPEKISNDEVMKLAEPFVAEVKQFRKEIDANIQKAEDMLARFPKEYQQVSTAREIALVRTKLQEAKMWAGKILEVLGNPFPPELADKADAR